MPGSTPTRAKDGWFRVDQAQRRLEAWVANLDDEPEERPLGVVRGVYEDACHAMAEGFTKALVRGSWTVLGVPAPDAYLQRDRRGAPKPVAYFLVDAMRFEMGVELAERLPKSAEVSVRPAICALPSITPIGMAALSRGHRELQRRRAGRQARRPDRRRISSRPRRAEEVRRRARARSSSTSRSTSCLVCSRRSSPRRSRARRSSSSAPRRSTTPARRGFTFQARQVMDTVIDNLARAIRKLAAAGVEHCVVTADHGHLFFASDRDESMRTDAPGGDQVELHRRCWIGRGGATPPGCVRVHGLGARLRLGSGFRVPDRERRVQSRRRSRLPPWRTIAARAGHPRRHRPHEGARTRRARPPALSRPRVCPTRSRTASSVSRSSSAARISRCSRASCSCGRC